MDVGSPLSESTSRLEAALYDQRYVRERSEVEESREGVEQPTGYHTRLPQRIKQRPISVT